MKRNNKNKKKVKPRQKQIIVSPLTSSLRKTIKSLAHFRSWNR